MDYNKLQEELNILKRYVKFAKNATDSPMQHLMWDGMGLSIVNLKQKLQDDMVTEKQYFKNKGGKVLVPKNVRRKKKSDKGQNDTKTSSNN